MEAKRISDQVLVIIIPERRITEDFGIKDDLLWYRIPEYLVSGFLVRHFKHIRDDPCIHKEWGSLLPDDWDKAKIGLEIPVSKGKIDVVLQSEQNCYVIEVKSGGQVLAAMNEVMEYAKSYEKRNPNCPPIKPVVVTSRRGDMSWAKIHLKRLPQ